MVLVDLVRKRTLETLGWDESVLDNLINATDDTLHDPLLYRNMEKLIDRLHEFAINQRDELLIVDTDYDTDGIMSACVLTAALSAFGIKHRVYIPSMKDGYGLSVKAVTDMLKTYNNVSMILTADNGTNANEGIAFAKTLGIPVLVTDHHLGSPNLAPADVIVNPNVIDDNYPFKGNAGATVAWKTMLAYAKKYRPDRLNMIKNLIVFAGIANVADMMPIVDENHYMVKLAVYKTKEYQQAIASGNRNYTTIEYTGIPGYDTVFHGLYDCLYYMQTLRDEERKNQGKKPSPLPTDEELFSWYLSPLLNAPRRVAGTPESAFKGLIHNNPEVRRANITQMIHENKQKSIMRDSVLSEIKDVHLGEHSNVLFVNTQHGIAGLIASSIVNKTAKPTIVFATPSNTFEKVYTDATRFDFISGSARSTDVAPLNIIVDRIRQDYPEFEITGGGHAQAAGYGINAKDLELFRELFDKYSQIVSTEIMTEYEKAKESGLVAEAPQNHVHFSFYEGLSNNEHIWYNIDKDNFGVELLELLSFWDELKPFGRGFDAKSTFTIDIDPMKLATFNIDFDFWKTFKVNIHGCEVLTFDIKLSDLVKERVNANDNTIITMKAEIKKNTWMGETTPQIILLQQ